MTPNLHLGLTICLPITLSLLSYIYSGASFTLFEWFVTTGITWFGCFTMYLDDQEPLG